MRVAQWSSPEAWDEDRTPQENADSVLEAWLESLSNVRLAELLRDSETEAWLEALACIEVLARLVGAGRDAN